MEEETAPTQGRSQDGGEMEGVEAEEAVESEGVVTADRCGGEPQDFGRQPPPLSLRPSSPPQLAGRPEWHLLADGAAAPAPGS